MADAHGTKPVINYVRSEEDEETKETPTPRIDDAVTETRTCTPAAPSSIVKR